MLSYVTPDDYFGRWMDHPDCTDEVKDNAGAFLLKVNEILDRAFMDGVDYILNEKTNSYVSGKTYGGFRPQDCPQGALHSSHKEGRGVDIYDPNGAIDDWCMKHQRDLEELGLHIEHPSVTIGWCHMTDRSPPSGRTVFMP